ncbi:DUF2865 domain-containing protein [Afipia clevelandensis]|uniref:DUF2865 domain-containing protein n=1 Tax=Afipia clevelandensis ATCC 49720 TaxID=883079 RepID=K8NTC8_9BRAD|nr:DUF2865 domain-containing protein [Afipia clevelandensis]EKS33592.1 hypothetical protein HMPREF9696_02712 [Afipia clevelandensis ATCC 49720]
MTLVLAVAMAMPMVLAPGAASAGIFDFLFGGDKPQRQEAQPQQQPSNAFADPFGLSTPNPAPAQSASSGGGRFTTYCVRTCDGRYFPLTGRGSGTPAQVCQAFCPASQTKVFSGNSIDYAVGHMGERYVDTPNAFAYRKALKADCTCNGRDPAGLAPVDLSLDATLRPGDIVATSSGLVAYSGTNAATQTAQFTPVNNYPGLTADLRARLGEMKVAPVTAELPEDTYSSQDITGSVPEPKYAQPMAPDATLPKIATQKARRAL